MKKTILIIFAVLLISISGYAQSSINVGVLNFKNVGINKSYDWIGEGFAYEISKKLIKLGKISASDYKSIFLERNRYTYNITDKSNVQKKAYLFSYLNITSTIEGTFEYQNEKINIKVFYVDKDGNKTDVYETVNFTPLVNFFDITNKIINNLFLKLKEKGLIDYELKSEDIDKIKELPVKNMYAFENYIKGLKPYYLNNIVDSVFFFNKALKYDKKYLEALIKLGFLYDQLKENFLALQTYSRLAAIYEDQKDFVEAEKYYKKAAMISRKFEFFKYTGVYLLNLGAIHLDRGEIDVAKREFYLSEKYFSLAKNKRGLIKGHFNYGLACFIEKDYNTAFKYFSDLLKNQKDITVKDQERFYSNLASAYYMLGETSKAIQYYVKSLIIAERGGNKVDIGRKLYNIGVIYTMNGEFLTAKYYMDKSIVFFEHAESKKLLQVAYEGRSDLYSRNKKPKEAIVEFKKSIELDKELPPKTIEEKAERFQKMGYLYDLDNQYDLSLENYENALKITTDKMKKSFIAGRFVDIASRLFKDKKYPDSTSYLLKARKLYEGLDEKESLVTTLHDLGLSLLGEKKYDEGKKAYENLLKMDKKLIKPVHRLGLALIYDEEKKFPESFKIYRQVLETLKDIKLRKYIACRINNMAIDEFKNKDFQKSQMYFDESLKVAKECEDPEFTITFLNHIALSYEKMNEPMKALDLHLEAAEVIKEVGDKERLADKYMEIGFMFQRQKQFDNAKKYINKAIQLSIDINSPNINKRKDYLVKLDDYIVYLKQDQPELFYKKDTKKKEEKKEDSID